MNYACLYLYRKCFMLTTRLRIIIYSGDLIYSNSSIVELFNARTQKFALMLKKNLVLEHLHTIGFLLAAAITCSRYPQTIVVVVEWRMLAHLIVFTGITTVMALLQGWGNHMKLFTNFDTMSYAHSYFSPQSELLTVLLSGLVEAII